MPPTRTRSKPKAAAKAAAPKANGKPAVPAAAAAPPKNPPAIAAVAKPRTKAEVALDLSLASGATVKQAAAALDRLAALAAADLSGDGPGSFTVPGIASLKIVEKAAVRARTGRNPQTGEPIEVAAKPAHNVIKITPIKSLREGV